MAIKLIIPLQIQVPLLVGDWKQISDLRANADNTRLVGTEECRLTTVGRNLLIEIANGADEELLGQELRGSPV